MREHFSGVTALPAAFVISTGGFALLGVPMLVLQSTLEAYLWVSGAAVAASVLAAALAALLWDRPAEAGTGPAAGDRGGVLWLPFLALVAVLTYITRITAPKRSLAEDVTRGPAYRQTALAVVCWHGLRMLGSLKYACSVTVDTPKFNHESGPSRTRQPLFPTSANHR